MTQRGLIGLYRRIAGWPLWIEAACLLALLGVSLAIVWPLLSNRTVFDEFDTGTYYYPVLSELKRSLDEGRLPLWTPRIFAGFPLFAEGETGSLYPFTLLALRVVSPIEAIDWINLANFAVAGWGMYFFGRALGLGRFASLVGGFSFQTSSFVVGQAHHIDLQSTAVWLPWILAGTERAIRSTGLSRLVGISIGGGALGIASLGLHPQPLLIGLVFVGAFIVWRLATGGFGFRWPLRWPGEWRVSDSFVRSGVRLVRNVLYLLVREVAAAVSRLLLIGLLIGGVIGAGLGLASIQLLPLAELASVSVRQRGVEYAFAATYSMPPADLVQLLLPYAFRTQLGYWWTLWAPWEISLYVGIGALILSIIAVLLVRSRLVLFFAIVAALSVVVAFGEYSPLPGHQTLYQVPGFSFLRVPGRFGFPAVAALSVLAMLGADWMDRRFRSSPAAPFGFLSRALATAVIGALAAFAAVLPAGLWWARGWIGEHGAETLDWINASYLGLRRGNEAVFSSTQVYQHLLETLDPMNEKTLLALALVFGVSFGLLGWMVLPRLRHVWRVVLLGIVAADGVLFASAYHRVRPMSSVVSPAPVEEFLASRSGLDRIYALPPRTIAAPNRMLPLNVADFGGYSSLDPTRVAAFASWMLNEGTALLNLANVRFIVVPNRPTLLPAHKDVSFWPERPLTQGRSTNPNSRATFRITAFRTDSVRVVSGLTSAVKVPQGDPVAEVVVSDAEGRSERLLMRAGEHTAEWAYDRPDVLGTVLHARPEEVTQQRHEDPDGRSYAVSYFYGELPLSQTMIVERLEFRNIHPQAGLRLFGIALWDGTTFTSDTMIWDRKNQFRRVYEDGRSVVYENLDGFRRARVVRRAAPPPAGQWELLELARGDYDPTTMTLLDAPPDAWRRYQAHLLDGAIPTIADGSSFDRAAVVDYREEEVVVQVEAAAPGFLVLHDAFYPGWRATVDGVETPVRRADYLYRAVPVPAGAHVVVWRYEPESVSFGGLMTVMAASCLFGFWVYALALRPIVSLLWRSWVPAAISVQRGRWRIATAIRRFLTRDVRGAASTMTTVSHAREGPLPSLWLTVRPSRGPSERVPVVLDDRAV